MTDLIGRSTPPRRPSGCWRALSLAGLLSFAFPVVEARAASAEESTSPPAYLWLDVDGEPLPFQDHDSIREAIARVVPGYEPIETIGSTRKEFQIEGRTFHEPTFGTGSGKMELAAVDVPEQGGDTLFADTVGAFEGCSEGFKAALRGLTGHNTASLVHQSGGGYASVTGQSVTLKDADRETEADHPLVVAHPETGREALFFSLIHTSHFVGMTRLESLPLLESLHERVIAPENVSRLRWQPGTLAIWDNRAVQHLAVWDYHPQPRRGERVTICGDGPPRPARVAAG